MVTDNQFKSMYPHKKKQGVKKYWTKFTHMTSTTHLNINFVASFTCKTAVRTGTSTVVPSTILRCL
jgi:hypothetical protein